MFKIFSSKCQSSFRKKYEVYGRSFQAADITDTPKPRFSNDASYITNIPSENTSFTEA